jgi:hypothetical protein
MSATVTSEISYLRVQAKTNIKRYIDEHLVPSTNIPHFSKLVDIQMMCVTSGKDRIGFENREYRRFLGPTTSIPFHRICHCDF